MTTEYENELRTVKEIITSPREEDKLTEKKLQKRGGFFIFKKKEWRFIDKLHPDWQTDIAYYKITPTGCIAYKKYDDLSISTYNRPHYKWKIYNG